MTKLTLYGRAAWVGAIHSPTECSWWAQDPAALGWDPAQLHRLDLALTPAAALAGTIGSAAVEVDDYTASGGRTTLGPLWPTGNPIGAAWLSAGYLARVGIAVPPGVPEGGSGHAYEYVTYQYLDGEQANRRFDGFHASVLQIQAGLSLVQIWSPGTGAAGGPPAGAWWLDLTADADPGTPPLAVGAPGALFLDSQTVATIKTFDPKLPPFRGGFAFPTQPRR